MKAGYIHIVLLVDRSGSMENIQEQTKAGIKAFIDSNKESTNEDATLTLVFFDTVRIFTSFVEKPEEVEFIHNFTKLHTVDLTAVENYTPRGGTNLLDAIGEAIVETGKKLSSMNEEDRPEKVAVAIITDGQENTSHIYSKQQITEMIKHQEEVYNWDISFISSDLSAVEEARELGVSSGKIAMFTKENTVDSFKMSSSRMARAYTGQASEYTQDELSCMVK